ncbi:amidohydrolase [Erysipelothrix larvae]|uniref:Amidohydrolase n=1 Tax=Erysipelothrix larvae TaxID=1514105 RepID=A0A120JTY6_9FIRM|nr:amidohydrolase family protein [Erysipelothrix larvae]AMC94365.1 amidohydrolase [Erysipelothrix larvae]
MQTTVFRNCNYIDLNESGYTVTLCDILVDHHGLIKEMAPHINVTEPSCVEVSIDNKYILAGLIDAHVHLFSSGGRLSVSDKPGIMKVLNRFLKTKVGKNYIRNTMHKNAHTQLQSGVTTLRSVGEFQYQDVTLRDEIINGDRDGPNLYVSGYFISIKGGHGAPYLALESDGPWACRKSVRKNLLEGVDWIKICVTSGVTDARRIGEAGRLQLNLEEIEAICDEAHRVGVMVSAHVESSEGVRIALLGGVDTIEHGAVLDDTMIQLFKNNPKALRGFTALIPTFSAAYPFALLDKEKTELSDVVYYNGKRIYEEMMEGFKQAIDHDITVGVGTDASMSFVKHYNFYRELDHIVRYGGVPAYKALYMATRVNACVLNDQFIGNLDIGKRADFIVLNDNPAENVQVLKEIEAVYKDGQKVIPIPINKDDEIDGLLDLT